MKKLILWQVFAVALALLSSCGEEESLMDSQVMNQEVSLSFYDVYVEEMGRTSTRADTRSTPLQNQTIFQHLDVALFPVGRDTTYLYHQNKTDSGFGTMQIKVPVGKYVLVAVANASTNAVEITSPTKMNFPEDKILDNVYVCDTIEVKSGQTNSVSCLMKRAIAGFKVVCTTTDASNISEISASLTGNCSATLSPATGFAANTNGYSRVFDVSKTSTVTDFTLYAYLGSDKETVSATIQLKGTDGTVMKTVQFNDVVLQRNRLTTYTGDLFSITNEVSFNVSEVEMSGSGFDKTFDE